MHSTYDTARPGGFRSTFRRGESWLDQRGKWAWIAATVLGFIFFWPVGLALLAYVIWGKRMFRSACNHRHADHGAADRSWGHHGYRAAQASGNHAFDSYKTKALRQLEDEQEAFEAFLQRLRNSKDKSEFDAFMEERARATAAQDGAEAAPSDAPKSDTGARSGEY